MTTRPRALPKDASSCTSRSVTQKSAPTFTSTIKSLTQDIKNLEASKQGLDPVKDKATILEINADIAAAKRAGELEHEKPSWAADNVAAPPPRQRFPQQNINTENGAFPESEQSLPPAPAAAIRGRFIPEHGETPP